MIGGVDRSWPRLCAVLQVDLSDDERFATEYQRFRHRRQLAGILQQRFLTQPRDRWISLLRDAGVPCGPVNSMDAVVTDAQFTARGMFPRDRQKHVAPIVVNTPVIADGAPRARGRSPRLGETAPELLAEIGYSTDDIASLSDRGIIALTPTDDDARSAS